MAHPSRAVHTLLVDLQVPMTERRWAEGPGDARVHCTGQKEVEGEESLKQGWFSPVYLTNIIIFNIFAAAAPTSASGSHPWGPVPPTWWLLLDSLHQPSLSSCF